MTQEQTAQVTEAILRKVRQTLVVKNAHYASEEDKLWNFKTQAAFESKKGSQVCFSHLMKQMTTMLKACNSPMELTFGTATQEGILQKPVDAICYIILLVCNWIDEQYEKERVQAVIDDLFPKEESK